MYTSVWGPSAWRLIHSVAFTYPKRPNFVERQRYKMFFESLAYTLPCLECQKNYQKELLYFDLDQALNSRYELSQWAFKLHNSVNKRLGKKIMTYDEVKRLYEELINSVDKEKASHKKQNEYDIFEDKKAMIAFGLLGIGFIYYCNRK